MRNQLKERQRQEQLEAEQAENLAVQEQIRKDAELDRIKKQKLMEETIAAMEAQQKAKEQQRQLEAEEDLKNSTGLIFGETSPADLAAENVSFSSFL